MIMATGKTLKDKYWENYEPGDAIILYVSLDYIDRGESWLYEEIALELQNAADFSLNKYNVKSKLRLGSVWHARDKAKPFKLRENAKWLSVASLEGATHYAGNLIQVGSQVAIAQVDERKLTHAYDIRAWIASEGLGKRISFYGYVEKEVMTRLENEKELLATFDEVPFML